MGSLLADLYSLFLPFLNFFLPQPGPAHVLITTLPCLSSLNYTQPPSPREASITTRPSARLQPHNNRFHRAMDRASKRNIHIHHIR
jgi:hypothetical protein